MENFNIERIDPFIKMKYDEKTNTYVEADPAVNNFGGVIPPIYREPMPYVTTSRAFNPYPEEKIPHWANKENIYVTNNAVSREVIEMFLKEIHECAYSLKEDILSGKLDCFIRVIAIILTQKLMLLVKHSRWFYVYNGKIYVQFADENALYPVIREFCENITIYVEKFTPSASITSHILREAAEMAVYLDFPRDISRYIVFNDGILNLDTEELEPFAPGRFITTMITANWCGGETYCNVFSHILLKYTQGDWVLYDRLREALGLCLTNDIVKKIICFQGVTNSGKSFLVNFLMRLINSESVVTLQPNEFEDKFALSKIYDKSLCACMDMEAAPLNSRATAVIKQISGSDTIGAEFKYQSGNVMFTSRAHIILCSNFNIVPYTEDIAFDMRKLVIPFRHRITDDNLPSEYLMYRLEAEKSAIVRDLIWAYLNLKERGYVFSGDDSWYNSYIPPNGNIAGRDMSLANFMTYRCEITSDDNECIFAEDLYAAYQDHVSQYGGYIFNSYSSFSQSFNKGKPSLP